MRDNDAVLRWKHAGAEAGELLRKQAVDPNREHGIEFVSAFATFAAAELLASESSETLGLLGHWQASDSLAQRALELLSSPPSPANNGKTRSGHVYSIRSLGRALLTDSMDRLARLVTTADHPLFRACLAPWIPVVGLSRALSVPGPERRSVLCQFLGTWDVGPERDIVFERCRPAPVPGDPDDWTPDYAARNVAFSEAEFRGFDAVEVQDRKIVCYHYIEAIWQTGDVDWPDPANAFWFLSEDELERGWAEVE